MEVRGVILAIVGALCLLAAVKSCGVSSIPYEDDPKNFDRQRISDMTGIQGKLYIKQRNFNKTNNRCHSAEKHSAIPSGFIYTLRADFNITKKVLVGYNTSFRVSTTPPHKVNNAGTYKMFPEYPEILWKLMYINAKKACCILVEDLENGKRGCQLVQTEETVDAEVPEDCLCVYNANCKGEQIKLYEPYCKNLPTIYLPLH